LGSAARWAPTRARVCGTLLRQLAWPVGLDMAIGMAGGFGASTLLGGEPFFLAVTEARVPIAALAVFAIAGLAAALIPASRALSADPVRALRHE
jgi:ABC-type antimicrobial peptide transport system permease subunit